MRTYDKYKPSGVDWIGDIPEHWQVKKLKYLADLVDEVIESSPFLIAVENIESKTGKLVNLDGEKNYQGAINGFRKGDILFNKLRPYLAKVYFAKQDGGCVGELLILRSGEELLNKFLFYRMLSADFIDVVDSSTTGTKMPRASWDGFINQLLIPFSPLSEQTAIADYLDIKTAQIDKLIAGKRRLIELLEEERRGVINNAVTRGINPAAKLKPSGIAWLGDIPEHWKLTKFAFFAPIITCGLASTPEYVDDGVPFLSAQNVKNNKLNLEKYRFISSELHQQLIKHKQPMKGDILVTRVGAGIGDACIVDIDLEFSIYVSLTHVRVNPKMAYNKFIMYFFSTDYCNVLNLAGTVTGGGVGNLNVNNVRTYKIPLPSVEEQKQIVEFIEAETDKIDATITTIKREIELINEYRTALISEVVTGKIKVF